MKNFFALTPALLISGLCLCAVIKSVDVMGAMAEGAKKGLKTVADMLPSLTVLFAAIYLLRASPLTERLTRLLAPLLNRAGIPEETALILLLRPLSGSGAIGAAADIMARCGADSLAGRTAAVMLSSSETTFYVIAVYFSAARVKGTRWAVPAALTADIAGFLASAWISRLLWG